MMRNLFFKNVLFIVFGILIGFENAQAVNTPVVEKQKTKISGLLIGTSNKDDGQSFEIVMNGSSKLLEIKYPSLSCFGILKIISKLKNIKTLKFSEKITHGNCKSKGEIILTQYSNDKRKFYWESRDKITNAVIASGSGGEEPYRDYNYDENFIFAKKKIPLNTKEIAQPTISKTANSTPQTASVLPENSPDYCGPAGEDFESKAKSFVTPDKLLGPFAQSCKAHDQCYVGSVRRIIQSMESQYKMSVADTSLLDEYRGEAEGLFEAEKLTCDRKFQSDVTNACLNNPSVIQPGSPWSCQTVSAVYFVGVRSKFGKNAFDRSLRTVLLSPRPLETRLPESLKQKIIKENDPVLKLKEISGTITVGEEYANSVQKNARLFVIARYKGVDSGPPLAVLRHSMVSFPFIYSIGPAHVMLEGNKFEGDISIKVRIDQDGNAKSSPGDIEGSRMSSAGDKMVDIVLDKIIPQKSSDSVVKKQKVVSKSAIADPDHFGRWVGKATEGDSRSIEIVRKGKYDFEIKYPSLKCGGKLRVLSISRIKWKLSERITYGRCRNKGQLTVTFTDNDHAEWKRRSRLGSINASGILKRESSQYAENEGVSGVGGTINVAKKGADFNAKDSITTDIPDRFIKFAPPRPRTFVKTAPPIPDNFVKPGTQAVMPGPNTNLRSYYVKDHEGIDPLPFDEWIEDRNNRGNKERKNFGRSLRTSTRDHSFSLGCVRGRGTDIYFVCKSCKITLTNHAISSWDFYSQVRQMSEEFLWNERRAIWQNNDFRRNIYSTDSIKKRNGLIDHWGSDGVTYIKYLKNKYCAIK